MCFWTHEKNTFFSLLKNIRSGGISQGRVSAAAAGGAQRRAFTDAGAKGTAREREKGRFWTRPFVFNTFTHVDRDVYIKQPRPDDFYP
jgi:hypothetical protein